MANEKTLEILKKMKADPKAKELFEGMEKPKSLDEMVSAYAQIAEKLGYGITAQDITQALKEIEAEIHQKTEAVSADMVELEDDDVENVAGGTIECGEPMQRLIDRFCWENNLCSIHIN